MESSILQSVKQMLGIAEDYDAFDVELIMHINSVFSILNQLGVGPDAGFMITGSNETWDEFLSASHVDPKKIQMVKSYVYQKTKIIFDPPSTGVLNEALERQIKEMEWRLYVQADPVETEEGGD